MNPDWLPAPTSHPELGHFIAAYWQSSAAFMMREQMREDGEDLETAAKAMGTSPDTLARKMRGEVPAKLRDLAMWVEMFGIALMPTLDTRADLMPRRKGPSSTRKR